MNQSAAIMAVALLASQYPSKMPVFVESGDKSKLPHWMRGHHGGSTKNRRYYKKRVERRRRNAGR